MNIIKIKRISDLRQKHPGIENMYLSLQRAPIWENIPGILKLAEQYIQNFKMCPDLSSLLRRKCSFTDKERGLILEI